MRNLIGMEMICFAKSEHFEMRYEGTEYLDERGKPVDDVLDMTCYACAAAFFTREGDPIPYCPNCGHIDRKRFHEREDLVAFMRGHDLTWLKLNGLKAVAVHTWEDDWRLNFVKDPAQLQAAGSYRAVREL